MAFLLGLDLLDPVPMPLPQQEHDVTRLVDNRGKQARNVPPQHAHVKGLRFGACRVSPLKHNRRTAFANQPDRGFYRDELGNSAEAG